MSVRHTCSVTVNIAYLAVLASRATGEATTPSVTTQHSFTSLLHSRTSLAGPTHLIVRGYTFVIEFFLVKIRFLWIIGVCGLVNSGNLGFNHAGEQGV